VLPLFTSGKARLLDNKRLINQFAALERKTTATRDRIDHPAHGAKDDVCNSAAGSMVLAADRSRDVPCVNPILFDLRTGADLRLNPAANWSTDRGYAHGSRSFFGDHQGW
jgi:hypothetical protein